MLKDTIFYHPTCRDFHSIETLLLRLLSDVYGISTDPTQFFTLLALFNVNAPFNTVDQEILHNWLHVSFGLSGNFLLSQWAFFYSFSVVHGPTRLGGFLSHMVCLKVPHLVPSCTLFIPLALHHSLRITQP